MDVRGHKAAIRETFETAAADFDGSGVDFFTPLGARLVHLAQPRAGDIVLDVGCGRGSSLFPARMLVGQAGRVVGIDLAEAMILHTAAEAAARGFADIELRVMDAEHPDFPANTFDLVLAGFSVMHLPGAPGTLGRYLPLLRPGGRFCFTDLVDQDGLPPMVPVAAFELLKPFFPASEPDPRARGVGSWTDSVTSIRRALHAVGFDAVEVLEEDFSVEIGSGEQWIEWTLSTGLRAAWDNVPASALSRLRSAVTAEIEALRDRRGKITMPVPVRFVLASTSSPGPTGIGR